MNLIVEALGLVLGPLTDGTLGFSVISLLAGKLLGGEVRDSTRGEGAGRSTSLSRSRVFLSAPPLPDRFLKAQHVARSTGQ